ncbi:hypothetical protein Taro_008230 [Colocasia esculenta]|uniref:CDT1 Geminin-binding domain-containing protein n=1 Tax=Colocasia esculenta TaxID=4460 RepID=A0A843TT75_COLES|nr:hypothetical protein [Colocasia esculenta]
MDPLAAGSQPSEKKKRPMSTPLKPLAPAVTRSASMPSPSHQIATPEKPMELPRRTRNRSVAFSLKEVREVASGLLRSSRVSSDQGEIAGQSKSAPPAEDLALGIDHDGTRPHPTVKSRIVLPEKRFSYGHLAQLKYILPEAISIKKILLRDEATCCMKPDLQVTLQTDAFESDKDQKIGSGYSMLAKVFRHRLIGFSNEHPQGVDVPGMDLPEPFNQTKPSMLPEMSMHLISKSASSNTEASSSNPSEREAAAPSHMPRSFQRRFSQKVVEKLPAGSLANETSEGMPLISSAPSPLKYASRPPISKKLLLAPSHIRLSSVRPDATKEETVEKVNSVDGSPKKDASMGTPAKAISTPARLISITPQLQTPKRCRPDTIDDSTPVKTLRRPTRTKLFTTPVKKTKTEDEECEAAADDVLQFLPKALLQSVREKEWKAREDQEAGVAEAEKRQRILAYLPKLFDMILLIFQSLGRSVITKQELIHKIVANHYDIVDRSEVEEQLVILQELAPDWISGKTASSGDFLFCVNNTSSPEDVRRRLSEANYEHYQG